MNEKWKTIKDYPNYEISINQQVRNINTGRVLKPAVGRNGYLVVNLSKDGVVKQCYIHRLIAESFIPNPDNLPMINHKDEDKRNNSLENLEWCDCKYNMNYGTCKERISNSKRGKPSARKGAKHTPEAIEKMKIAHSGTHHDSWNLEKHWYNNGEKSVMRFECPEGFVPGRISWKGK